MYIQNPPHPMFYCNLCNRGHLSSYLAQSCCKRKEVWPELPTQTEVGNAIAKLPTHPFEAPNSQTNLQKYPKYFRDVSGLMEIDVYGVCKLFGVSDASGAIHHAIKKLLLSGVRNGGKPARKDIEEARDTINRYLEIYK